MIAIVFIIIIISYLKFFLLLHLGMLERLKRELKIKNNNIIITSNPLPIHLFQLQFRRNVNSSQLLLWSVAFNGYLKDMLWTVIGTQNQKFLRRSVQGIHLNSHQNPWTLNLPPSCLLETFVSVTLSEISDLHISLSHP